MDSQAPIANGSKKVAVIGPDATPPESKAMAVNILGEMKVSPNAMTYPGTKKYITDIPNNDPERWKYLKWPLCSISYLET